MKSFWKRYGDLLEKLLFYLIHVVLLVFFIFYGEANYSQQFIDDCLDSPMAAFCVVIGILVCEISNDIFAAFDKRSKEDPEDGD